MEEKIKELSLLLMLLTGWEEDSRQNPGEKAFCSWFWNILKLNYYIY